MKKIHKQEDGMFWYCGEPIRKTRDVIQAKINSKFNDVWNKFVRRMERVGITVYSEV